MKKIVREYLNSIFSFNPPNPRILKKDPIIFIENYKDQDILECFRNLNLI